MVLISAAYESLNPYLNVVYDRENRAGTYLAALSIFPSGTWVLPTYLTNVWQERHSRRQSPQGTTFIPCEGVWSKGKFAVTTF